MSKAAHQLKQAQRLNRLDDTGLRRLIETEMRKPGIGVWAMVRSLDDIGQHVMSRAAYGAIRRIVDTYTLIEVDALFGRNGHSACGDLSNGGPSASIRAVVLAEEPTCAYYGLRPGCLGTDKPQVDHKMPRSRGGDHERANLQRLCKSCNSWKHAKTDEEARSLLAAV